jgi:FMN phosphatase YigB (HAD superfamily)
MAQLSRIKLAIFDVDGTLYHNEELMRIARHMYIEIVQSTMPFSTTFEQAEMLYKELYRELKDGIKVLQRRNVREGNEVKITELLDEITKGVRKKLIKYDPELTKLFYDLKSQDMNIFVCRNGTLPVTEMILQNLFGLHKSHQTISHRELGVIGLTSSELLRGTGPVDLMIPTTELGVLKPDRKPFKLMARIAEESGIQTNECVMVGDSYPHDLTVPIEMGMKTILIGKKEGQKNAGADFMIPNIYHLRSLLL